jgi:Relaxase/Mobilisation nuclease domain
MVAVVSNSGKFFKGLINYLYVGKLKDQGDVDKQSEIILYSDNLRIPFGEEDSIGRKRMVNDFIEQAKTHRNYGDNTTKYVGEHILSFKSEDIRLLSKEKIPELCERYISDAGLGNTQFIAVSHGDTDNFHIHIVFNRCQNDKTMYPAWKEKVKTSERAVAIALKYGFALTGNQEQLADTKGVWEVRMKHQDIIDLSKDPNLQNIRNLKHLQKVCESTKTLTESSDEIRIDNKSYKKRDLDVIFFMNRQSKSEISEKKRVNKPEKRKVNEKNKRNPDSEIKENKSEKKEDELNNTTFECQTQKDLMTNTHHPMEENQDFNYKKSWGSDDKDEFKSNKRRKRS